MVCGYTHESNRSDVRRFVVQSAVCVEVEHACDDVFVCGECGTEVERANFVSRVMTSVVCGGECGTVIERAHFVSRV